MAYPYYALLLMGGALLGSLVDLGIRRIPCGQFGISRSPAGRGQSTDPAVWRRVSLGAAGALYLLALGLRFGLDPCLLLYTLFGLLMMAATAVDLEHCIIPNSITIPGVICGLVLSALLPLTSFSDAFIGTLSGFGIALLLMVASRGGIGGGDAKLLSMIGAFLGLWKMLFILFVAALAGSVISIWSMLRGKSTGEDALPFAPFLAFGSLFVVFVGEETVESITRLLGL